MKNGLEIKQISKEKKKWEIQTRKSAVGQLQASERQSGGRDSKKEDDRGTGEEGCTGREQCSDGTIPVLPLHLPLCVPG